jgi:hypothetical protein
MRKETPAVTAVFIHFTYGSRQMAELMPCYPEQLH